MANVKGDSAIKEVPAVLGENTAGGDGVRGTSKVGTGVIGTSESGVGVWGGSKSSSGVGGMSDSGIGVHGVSKAGPGVRGDAENGTGVFGGSKHQLPLAGSVIVESASMVLARVLMVCSAIAKMAGA